MGKGPSLDNTGIWVDKKFLKRGSLFFECKGQNWVSSSNGSSDAEKLLFFNRKGIIFSYIFTFSQIFLCISIIIKTEKEDWRFEKHWWLYKTMQHNHNPSTLPLHKIKLKILYVKNKNSQIQILWSHHPKKKKQTGL